MHLPRLKSTAILSLAGANLIIPAHSFSLQPQQPLVAGHELIQDIPSVGLGLWNSKDTAVKDAIAIAFETGYIHLDSAADYGNEKAVGEILANETSPHRSSYWITSKLWNDMHQPANVPLALNRTLTDLGVEYLDLYLMHWPVAFLPNQKPGRNIIDQDITIVDTWRAMQDLISKNRTHPEPGTTRFIGISNFSPRQIDQLLSNKDVEVLPYAHEFETHPWLQQQDFVNWHHEHGIRVIAYSPLANLNPEYKDVHPDLPRIIDDKFFVDLAKNLSRQARQNPKNDGNVSEEQKKKKNKKNKDKTSVTAAQVILAWNLSRNVTVIPKSVHEMYIKENYKSIDIELKSEEMQQIADQDKKARFNNPGKDWGVKLFEGLDGA